MVTDPKLVTAFIAATVSISVFLCGVFISAFSRWRDREREGIEIVVDAMAAVIHAMHRDGTPDALEENALLLMAGTRVQIRISRSLPLVNACIHVGTAASLKARDRHDLSNTAKVQFLSGLYAVISDELISWHKFKISGRTLKKRVMAAMTKEFDAETGL
jgi:hypothetical protein